MQDCLKVAQNVRFSGGHGDLPLRKPVGATLCGRPYLLMTKGTLTEIKKCKFLNLDDFYFFYLYNIFLGDL
jgi:hypothetical protein